MARTIGYSRFRDSKPSYLYAQIQRRHVLELLLVHRPQQVRDPRCRQIDVIEETTAPGLVCTIRAATIVRTAIPVTESSRIASSPDLWFAVKLSPPVEALPPIRFEKQPRWCYRWIPRLRSLLRPGSDENSREHSPRLPATVCAIVDGVIVRRIPTNRSTSPRSSAGE